MPTIDQHGRLLRRFTRLSRSVGAKLIAMLLGAMLVIFALLGYLNVELHRRHLEAGTLRAAEQLSDVIQRSTSYYMLRNDREGLHQIMRAMGGQPGLVRVRIIDQKGRVGYSSDTREVDTWADKSAPECHGCHDSAQPLTTLDLRDRFRVYRAGGKRVLAIIQPIENQAMCSNAACHAHPANQKVLGVLDTNLSLAAADAGIGEGGRQMAAHTAVAAMVIAFLSWLFVWRVVERPVQRLMGGTQKLSQGQAGYQLPVVSEDELGELATSFNRMSLQIRNNEEQLTTWARTLEDRVAAKTKELRTAHEHVLHVEKMACIGKLAAVVAHEINNPLSAILTYSKLLRRWLERDPNQFDRRHEVEQTLDLIAGESRRCGDLVKNLLTFSRTAAVNLAPADLNAVIQQSLRLIQHETELLGIQCQLALDDALPQINCDAGQIEQVVLALLMNAMDAMPRGGNLWLSTRAEGGQVLIQVRDDGVGIAPDLLPRIFEPFLTTKETGKGVGLGLAISRGIVEQHGGTIEVASELGRGTTFTVRLPRETNAPVAGETLAMAGEER